MFNCIIIDDEQNAINVLGFHIRKISDLNVLKTFTNPIEALSFLEETDVDLIFLDIQMPELGGMQLIKLLKKKAEVIITSGSREYAIEGFENKVSDYLLKPISLERLLSSFQSAKKKIELENSFAKEKPWDFIVLKTDSKNKFLKVDISDIIYIEGLKNYISVFTSQQRIITLLNMKLIEESLPPEKFIRVHRSYIVSIDKISVIDGNQLYLKGIEMYIPIGESYKNPFLNYFKNQLIQNKKQ